MSEIGLMRHLHERNKLAAKLECPDCNGGGLLKETTMDGQTGNFLTTDNKECPDCNGGGLVKGSNEYEWETHLERCEACNGDGYVEVQNKPTAQ